MTSKRVTFDDFVGSRVMHKKVPAEILETFGFENRSYDIIGFQYMYYWIFFDAAYGKFWTICCNEDDNFDSLDEAEIWLFEKFEDELNWDYVPEVDPMLDPQLG